MAQQEDHPQTRLKSSHKYQAHWVLLLDCLPPGLRNPSCDGTAGVKHTQLTTAFGVTRHARFASMERASQAEDSVAADFSTVGKHLKISNDENKKIWYFSTTWHYLLKIFDQYTDQL